MLPTEPFSNLYLPSSKEKKQLLSLSRETLTSLFKEGGVPMFEKGEDQGWFRQKNGLFVTFLKEGDVRGQLGTVVTKRPLLESVKYYTEESALRDPRHFPLSSEELQEISIEISIVAPPLPLEDFTDWESETNGLVIVYNQKQYTFFPVAWQYRGNTENAPSFEQQCSWYDLSLDIFNQKEVKLFQFSLITFKESLGD